MKIFGLYILLSLLTRNPLLALFILLLVIFIAERRFVGILPDVFRPWRQANRVRQLKREVGINPANAEAYLELGEAYFRQGKYKDAASFLENAYSKMAGHPLFHFYLGASYYHLGKLIDGKREIEKAIEANPKVCFGEPYIYLVRIYRDEKRPDAEIEQACDKLLQYGSPGTFYQADTMFLSFHEKERAKRLFRETIENYEACRGPLRRAYRRWAFLSKIAMTRTK
jgi:tetratricopeptide (TPR) repeat protein